METIPVMLEVGEDDFMEVVVVELIVTMVQQVLVVVVLDLLLEVLQKLQHEDIDLVMELF
jgi:hypothetical protein